LKVHRRDGGRTHHERCCKKVKQEALPKVEKTLWISFDLFAMSLERHRGIFAVCRFFHMCNTGIIHSGEAKVFIEPSDIKFSYIDSDLRKIASC
jgi:hypothetical protein